MPRLFSSLSVSGALLLLVACGDTDSALFSDATAPTAPGAGGNTTKGQGGTDDQGQGGDEGTSEGGESGTSGDAGSDNPGNAGGADGEGGADAGVFGGNGGDPGAGGTGDGGSGGSDGGQSASGAPGVGGQPTQGGGGQPPVVGGQGPQGGGGKPPGGASGSGGSGQAGKAGSSGAPATGDGVKCAMSEDSSVGTCKGGGKGCCLDSEGANPCVSSEQCQVSDETSYFGFLACDGPEDCNGGQCCIGKQNYNAQCRPSCTPEENPMCHPGVGGLLGCTVALKSCQKITESNFDTGGLYYECR